MPSEFAVTPDVTMRLAVVQDAEGLCAAYRRNREYLRPWEPDRPDGFFTVRGQTERLADQVADHRAGRLVPWVLTGAGGVVGTVTLSRIALGPLRSAVLGYWIDAGCTGRGLATAAAELACEAAGRELGLHRVEAGAAVGNTASQRVLRKAGFELIGTARSYLHVGGAWRDHLLFQRILDDRRPAG